MDLFLVIIMAVLLLIFLLFTKAIKIMFNFNLEKSNLSFSLSWLYPFIKAVVRNEGNNLVLTVYLLKKSIVRKVLNTIRGGGGKANIIRQINPTDIRVNASYGFKDPFITGIACAAIGSVSHFIKLDSLNQEPDFVTSNDYVNVDATARVNLGSAIINIYRKRFGDLKK